MKFHQIGEDKMSEEIRDDKPEEIRGDRDVRRERRRIRRERRDVRRESSEVRAESSEVRGENTTQLENDGTKMIFGIENIPDRIRKGNNMPYQVVTHDIVEEADVCIIGSGAAGAILANKIVSGIDGIEGKNVVLIEKGGYYDPEDFNQREVSMMRLLWKNAGLQLTTDLSMLIAQGECVGGSTMINDAVCFDTPPLIREQWRNDGVSIDEPKWNDAITEVRNKISVSRLTDEDIRKNKNALILKEACENHNPPYVGANNERNCIDCKTCGDCHLGCHYETKQDMCNTYIYDALHLDNSKKFRIYANCDVRKINYEGGTATSVEGKFLQQGKEKFSITVNAKVIILAAGSIASSSILLGNNIAKHKAGKGLALHPATLLIGKFKDEVRASEGIPMAYACHQFSVLNYQNNGKQKGGFILESIFIPIYQFALQLPWKPDVIEHVESFLEREYPIDDLMKDFQKYAMAGVMIRDESNGNITLSEKGNPKINYKLGDSEINDLKEGIKELAGLLFDAGAEKVITGHAEITELTSRAEIENLINTIESEHQNGKINLKLGSAHPQGGNRMGDDPTKCVVDVNCKVYDFNNLFVCDASVFPSSLGVNPQITVMSLATMTAENILKTWDENFEDIRLEDNFGETCDITRPISCGFESLSIMFNQNENTGGDNDLLNSNRAAQTGWLFDRNSLIINNEFHWRGFIPEFELPKGLSLLSNNLLGWLTNYLEGFWKEFHMTEDGKVRGNLNVYLVEGEDIEIIPERINHEIYGDVIQLTYPSIPIIYDLIKIIDEYTIIGKVFLGAPPNGLELVPFCMTTKYPVEWMDEDDHNKIFDGHSDETTLDENQGYWSLRVVTEHLLSPVLKVFHFITDGDESKKEDSLMDEMRKKFGADIDKAGQGRWTNSIHKVNENFMVGKFISPSFDNSINVLPQYTETITENGITKKRFVIRYSLSTVAGSWIRS